MFTDRTEAGRALAELLRPQVAEHPVVLALPRGGVPVAIAVAQELDLAELDVLVVRKIGAPWNPEYGVGAVGEDGVGVVDHEAVQVLRISEAELERVRAAEAAEVQRRIGMYRQGRPAINVTGRTVIVVDDGIATGSTLLAAVALLRERGAGRIVVAAPVASRQSVTELRRVADEVVVVQTPRDFRAVGLHYRDFSQVPDAEVVAALTRFSEHRRDGAGDAFGVEVTMPVARAHLPGQLTIPADAVGLVVFVHGSGSSRHSPRNVAVARDLQRRGIGTLLFDLLTVAEADDRANVFDIEKLAGRLVSVTRWLRDPANAPRTGNAAHLPLGFFGASTGGGAALVADTGLPPGTVSAIVSRGGRPDLAGPALSRVAAPTLLIVGGNDQTVIGLNRAAARHLACPHELAIVPGATHLFSEPGTLERVSELAGDWFLRHFR
jgi:predicted phosphoribosyltransferase/predicted alpha/beta-hydrolase family hydrolase